MPRPHSLPGALPVVAALVGAEGALLVGVAVFYLIELAVATASDVTGAWVSAGVALVAGVSLLLVARALWAGRRWARSPALVTNLIVAPVAIGLLQGGRWYAGAPLLVAAATVVVLLFSASTNAALDASDPDEQR